MGSDQPPEHVIGQTHKLVGVLAAPEIAILHRLETQADQTTTNRRDLRPDVGWNDRWRTARRVAPAVALTRWRSSSRAGTAAPKDGVHHGVAEDHADIALVLVGVST